MELISFKTANDETVKIVMDYGNAYGNELDGLIELGLNSKFFHMTDERYFKTAIVINDEYVIKGCGIFTGTIDGADAIVHTCKMSFEKALRLVDKVSLMNCTVFKLSSVDPIVIKEEEPEFDASKLVKAENYHALPPYTILSDKKVESMFHIRSSEK